ncbi:MAG: endonuclease MutS2 [Gudongella sp.]|jgi:DNA mismatch repair protein MutS2|nr:endonuclease MutS2 [Gudongella sp.]
MNQRSLKVLEFTKIRDILADKAESSLGRNMALEISPTNSLPEAEYLQDETAEALSLLIKRGNPPLFGISSITPDIKRAELGGMLNPGALLRISETLRVSRALKNYMKDTRDDKASSYPVVGEMIENLTAYRHIEDAITNAIISENEISDNASSTLRSIRRQIRSKNDGVRDKLNSIINSSVYKKYLQDSIVTMRDGRYVIPVKQENRANIPGLVHDISSSGATAFVEPMAVVELNNELKELEIKEREEIERILLQLSGEVASEAEGIRGNETILSRLDFVFAKGKLALDMKATQPIFNSNGQLNIKQARHPLLSGKVVPIDVFMGKDFNTLIITGPNTGGKTVTLKTVGLLTLMGQAGLHIPASFNSQLAVFNDVFADIGDEQSIEQSLSTFSSHMTNIVQIFSEMDENSLVLFDELGAGTDPVEGAALAMAILDQLKTRNIRTIATTHYSQLKVYALTTDNVNNASVEFDIETLSPTYKLLIGVPGKSNAFEISRRLGLPENIISRAKDLVSQENIEFEDVLQAMDKDIRLAEKNRLQSEKAKYEIERLRLELEKEKNNLNDNREKILQKAREEALKIIKEAKDNADFVAGELRVLAAELDKDKARRLQETQDIIREELKERERVSGKGLKEVITDKPPEDLLPGETVELLTLNQTGIVLTTPDEKGNVEVQVGIMKVTVKLSTLRRTSNGKETNILKKSSKKSLSTKSKQIKTELDLRGRNIEEGIFEVDKYLDDAYISGLKEVYIIHGRGTGILREGISQYLKGHKHVKSMRLGKYGEGGDGVTVVELK